MFLADLPGFKNPFFELKKSYFGPPYWLCVFFIEHKHHQPK